jgi:hypothetical protein
MELSQSRLTNNQSRAANWNEDQVDALMRLYTTHITTIDGKYSASVTLDLKKNKWAEIADAVSELGPIRTSKQCQKKVSDTKSAAKGKAARIHLSDTQTGGGVRIQESLTQLEQLVVAKIPGKQWFYKKN